MKRIVLTALLLGLAVPAFAVDLGRVKKLPPDDVLTSKVAMYDIERCMIDVDAIDTPAVYRQPDRPNEVAIAWATAIVVELKQEPSGTLVRTHFQSPGGRKARKRLLDCATTGA